MIFANHTKCFEGTSLSAKPSTAKIGDRFFETDTKREYFWDGIGWTPPQNLYSKYNISGVNEVEMFTQAGTIQDIYENEDDVVVVNVKSGKNLAMLNKSTGVVTRLEIGPRGADATDLPIDPNTGNVDWDQFFINPNPKPTDPPETPGTNITARSITEIGDYYVIGLRYSAGIQRDGTHLCGGICFVNKATRTVAKTYWIDYFVSRVVYDKETGLLAAGLQMGGLRFYTVSGTTLTEVITFQYDQSDGSATKGRESQQGCFYSQSDGRRIYANTGFGKSIRFYDVTDPANITYISEVCPGEYSDIAAVQNPDGLHTYTSIVRFPYLYASIARQQAIENPVPIPQLDGVLTVDVSDVSNPKMIHFEHINESDGMVKNSFGDTKPTEMEIAQNVLYLNYEKGYLVFEIDARGGSTKYCGRFTESTGYGIRGRDDGSVIFGINSGAIRTYDSKLRYSISNDLSRVVTNNPITSVFPGSAYTAILSPVTGHYDIKSVSILMGGVDITQTAWNSQTNTIYIAEVTADVVITASTWIQLWSPEDAQTAQYTNGAPCELTVNGNDISMNITLANSGLKSNKSCAPFVKSYTAELIADAVTFNEANPGSKAFAISIVFYDANNSPLHTYGFVSQNTIATVEDIGRNGIRLNFNTASHGLATADHFTVVMRTGGSTSASNLPIEVSFTNVRINMY